MLATPGINDFIVILDHIKSDFNIGKIFRSADAFGAREIHLIGIEHFDPTPAKGAFKWVPAKFHDTIWTCHTELTTQGYTVFALEPSEGHKLTDIVLPKKAAFILGHEEFGHSFEIKQYSGMQTLKIPQFGITQSLNVSIAASITMYEYVRQHGKLN